jgi:hypothetical protein
MRLRISSPPIFIFPKDKISLNMGLFSVCQVSGGNKSLPAAECPVVLDRVLFFSYAPAASVYNNQKGES